MQVSVENTSGLERRLTVQIPGEEIQGKIDSKLRELCKQVRIKGFRPGRVPMSVVKQRYGKQVRQDILNETMQQSLQQAIRTKTCARPACRCWRLRRRTRPARTSSSAPWSRFIRRSENSMPAHWKSSARRRKSMMTTSTRCSRTLRQQRRTWSEVEREVQDGDQVVIEYSAETDDGPVPEEGTQRLAIIKGESEFEDLDKAIAKIPAGKSKTLKLDFPEGFREPALAGTKAKTKLKVVKVSEGVLPEVDEELIKSFGVEDGEMDSFREEIRKNLERELKQATGTMLKAQLIEELKKTCPDMEVPPGVVREEATSMAAQMLQRQGHQLPEEQVRALAEPFMEQAENRVRAGLLLGELAQQNSIRVDAGKVRAAIETVASTYEEPAEVMQLYYGNQQLMQQVESSVLEEQVVDWVLENAKVTTKEMNFQDVIAAASASQT